ncbi:MAG: TatD family hydrolase [Candidatus Woesearchaeota archaeon]|nr:TatD family hydrolase [Candidatus Woesearchaeota archaeon]
MLLVDVHAHLNHARFTTDLPEVIKRAEIAGVKAIIVNGVNHATNQEVLALAKQYPVIKSALGLYPTHAINFIPDSPEEQGLNNLFTPVEETLNFIREKKSSIIAIGEVGLDYKDTKEPEQIKLQKKIFQQIIELAEQIKKPLIVHSRSAESDVIEMLQSSSNKKIVMHCFGGRKTLARKAADAGFYFSIPPVCQRLKHFEMIIQEVSMNQLLTETDSPYLSPVAGTRNEPANVLESIKKIAEIKKFTSEETANNVWMNYQKMFL